MRNRGAMRRERYLELRKELDQRKAEVNKLLGPPK